MSVLIKGMEMPTSCAKCDLFGEYGCAFIGAVGYALSEGRRSDDCPLVELPEHGDLIDINEEVNVQISSPYGPRNERWTVKQVLWMSCSRPSVIVPASELKKGNRQQQNHTS